MGPRRGDRVRRLLDSTYPYGTADRLPSGPLTSPMGPHKGDRGFQTSPYALPLWGRQQPALWAIYFASLLLCHPTLHSLLLAYA